MSSILVHIPSPLRSYTGGASTCSAHGLTLGALMDDLDRAHPGLKFRVIDEQDRVRRHMKLFVGTELTDDLGASLDGVSEVHIIAALSGG